MVADNPNLIIPEPINKPITSGSPDAKKLWRDIYVLVYSKLAYSPNNTIKTFERNSRVAAEKANKAVELFNERFN